MTVKIDTEKVAQIIAEEAAAQQDEALAQLPEEYTDLRAEKLELDKQIDALEARKDEIKKIFRTALESHGLRGFIVDGKVKVRVKYGDRTGVDVKELRKKMPHIAKRFATSTPYTSVTVD